MKSRFIYAIAFASSVCMAFAGDVSSGTNLTENLSADVSPTCLWMGCVSLSAITRTPASQIKM
jgi:hypothetical protein